MSPALPEIALATAAILHGCATRPGPLPVTVARAGEGCAIEMAGRRFGYEDSGGEQMRSLAIAWPNRRAVLNMIADAPYRCVGGVIYALQHARFQRIDLMVDGRPLPVPISK